jgi:hypothetical protein
MKKKLERLIGQQAAENIKRPDEAVSPTYVNT